MRIFLHFLPEQSAAHRSRLLYAFRLFCAVYGHQPVLDGGQAKGADVWIEYSPGRAFSSSGPTLQLSDLYRPRSLYAPAPPPTAFELDGERTVLFYPPLAGQQPDWLGEIFEWVSCADEYSVRLRDPIGNIPYAESYVGRHKLDARVPYAAIAMCFLQRALSRVVPGYSGHPIAPVPSIRHFVVCTHDVDFLPVSYFGSLRRLAKNAVISLLVYRSPRLAIQQVGKLLRMTVGRGNPLDQVSRLAQAEVQQGYNASYYFLVQRRHRRDGNYRITQPMVLDVMRSLERDGMEVGVHGSYTSLDGPEELASEFACLWKLGFPAKGGRQHWLRFTLDRLIPSLEHAGVLYDSSLGWNGTIGFRGGACFPFPLYNFDHERPSTFLEIPLVIMEESLLTDNVRVEDWYNHVAELLSMSRRYGWGGISILWHPTAFGGGQHPSSMGDLFWRLTDHREEWKDTWTSAADFVQLVRQRYVEVGLLPRACAFS